MEKKNTFNRQPIWTSWFWIDAFYSAFGTKIVLHLFSKPKLRSRVVSFRVSLAGKYHKLQILRWKFTLLRYQPSQRSILWMFLERTCSQIWQCCWQHVRPVLFWTKKCVLLSHLKLNPVWFHQKSWLNRWEKQKQQYYCTFCSKDYQMTMLNRGSVS